jgi:hypothetical protein
LFTSSHAIQQELQRERSFPDAWIAVDQVETVSGKAAVKHVIQAGNAG